MAEVHVVNSSSNGPNFSVHNPAQHPLPVSAAKPVTASVKPAGQPHAVVHGQVNASGIIQGPIIDNPA